MSGFANFTSREYKVTVHVKWAPWLPVRVWDITAQEVESLHSLDEQSYSTPDSQRVWDQCKTQTEHLAAPADEY